MRASTGMLPSRVSAVPAVGSPCWGGPSSHVGASSFAPGPAPWERTQITQTRVTQPSRAGIRSTDAVRQMRRSSSRSAAPHSNHRREPTSLLSQEKSAFMLHSFSRGTSTAKDCGNCVERSSQVMQVFPPPRNSSLPASLNHPSPADPLPLPPPQPKSCDLIIRPSLHQPEPIPPDPSPQSSRSGIARVSFREPISCSYSVEEDEERREGDEEQAEEEDGGFGSRLHMQKGIPPQMDLLDGSYQHRSLRRGWNRGRVASDSTLHLGTETRFRHSQPDRPRLDALERRRERESVSLSSPGITEPPLLNLQPTQYNKHEDSCSTCSSSSDSEEDGYFLGQPIPLPPQLTHRPQSVDGEREGERDGKKEGEKDMGLRNSLRRKRRANGLGAKDKDKNCAIS